jgi:hypothetical protein
VVSVPDIVAALYCATALDWKVPCGVLQVVAQVTALTPPVHAINPAGEFRIHRHRPRRINAVRKVGANLLTALLRSALRGELP